MDVESGVLDRGRCEPEVVPNIDGDFERLGRSTCIAKGLGLRSVLSVPFATLGCSASAIFWRGVMSTQPNDKRLQYQTVNKPVGGHVERLQSVLTQRGLQKQQ